MTSATTTPGRGTSVRRVPGRGSGAVLFASVLLMVVGCSAVIHGLAAVANSHVFAASARYAAANLRTWGWITAHLPRALQRLRAVALGPVRSQVAHIETKSYRGSLMVGLWPA